MRQKRYFSSYSVFWSNKELSALIARLLIQ